VEEPPKNVEDEISCAGPGYKPHGEWAYLDYGFVGSGDFDSSAGLF